MIHRIVYLSLIVIFFLGDLTAQKEDFIWQLGYNNNISNIDGTELDFNTQPLSVTARYGGSTDLDNSNTSVSDAKGNLLFYTNGGRIYNHRHEIMENGDSLSPTPIGLDHLKHDFGQRVKQNVLILPWPDRDSIYFLMHHYLYYNDDEPGLAVDTLLYSIVNMARNDGEGEVVKKNQPIFFDQYLMIGRITACRHANGRDWWILARRYHNYGFHRFLFDPNGLNYLGIQDIGPYVTDGIGEACFSPEGSMYAFQNRREQGTNLKIDLYDFNRCTGFLSNPIHLEYQPEVSFSGRGVDFSPNNKYLYASSSHYIYQFDMQSDDIQQSMKMVAEIDGYDCPETTSSFIFNAMQLAPDGRIYISGGGSHCHLSYINFPDRRGPACDVVQHGLKLKTWNFKSLPDFPHFRLGPMHGSACDTLGIERPPVARFRDEAKEVTDPYTIQYTDLSWYQPFEWQWSFGDGMTDTLQHPVHSYQDTGQYTVCLTVTNPDGMDTHCDTIHITEQTTDINQPQDQTQQISVYPVPSHDEITISGLERGTPMLIVNLHGRVVDRLEATAQKMRYDISPLPPGMYWIRTPDASAKFIRIK